MPRLVIACRAPSGRGIAMGLHLHLNFFRGTSPEAVYQATATFYTARGQQVTEKSERDSDFAIYEPDNGWVLMWLERGWEWQLRREALRFVTNELGCLGMLIFVYDGDYWGYEVVKSGTPIDQFVSEMEFGSGSFEGPMQGSAEIVAAACPWVKPEDVAPYLVQNPFHVECPDFHPGGVYDVEGFIRYWKAHEAENLPARPGDEFPRWDECAVLDFLRMLGISVELRDHCVTFLAPVAKCFKVFGGIRINADASSSA